MIIDILRSAKKKLNFRLCDLSRDYLNDLYHLHANYHISHRFQRRCYFVALLSFAAECHTLRMQREARAAFDFIQKIVRQKLTDYWNVSCQSINLLNGFWNHAIWERRSSMLLASRETKKKNKCRHYKSQYITHAWRLMSLSEAVGWGEN